jgi:RNA polymerase sigma factor (TIGR02999 family)
MSDATRLIEAAVAGDPKAAADLLPLVYEELRKLAAVRLASEKPGQTLQATSLVHEAFLRLVGGNQPRDWDGRGHFFAAAAEAMRRILVEQARRKHRLRHGGHLQKRPLDETNLPSIDPLIDPAELLAVNEALDRLEAISPRRARLVKLRYYVGLTMPEVAEVLGLSQSTVEADWTFTKAWLKRELGKGK